MAASAVEESEVVKTLSVNLGISKDVIAQLASLNEDTATVLLKVKQVFDEHSSKDEKYRSDMGALRRARVDAGLNFAVKFDTNHDSSDLFILVRFLFKFCNRKDMGSCRFSHNDGLPINKLSCLCITTLFAF